MSRKPLDLTDRCIIEKGLVLEHSFSEIAASLDCSPSTVMREIRNNRVFVTSSKTNYTNFGGCMKRKICGNSTCFNSCKACREYDSQYVWISSRFIAVDLTTLRMSVTPTKTAASARRNTRYIPRTRQRQKTVNGYPTQEERSIRRMKT